MARHLQLDDLITLNSPDNIANLFRRLGYNADAQPLDLEGLGLNPRSSEAVYDAYLIANQGESGLQALHNNTIISEPDREAIAALVQKCLDAKGVGVEEWEAEIDERVAHLYGLTAEEMKIIRGE
jgi:hypothetical protein